MANNDSELSFKPFADAVSQSMLDELTFENHGDCVSIYGSLQITRDADGLAHAKQLARIINDAVSYLEASDFSDKDRDLSNQEMVSTKKSQSVDEDQPFNWDE